MIPITQYLNNIVGSIYDSSTTILSEDVSLTTALICCINWLDDIRREQRTVYVIGNGGSAAIASHVQNDLCKGACIRAMVFNETPLLSAYANDISYEDAFEQMLRRWAEPGDLLIAISSSGRSKNILNSMDAAKEIRLKTITLSGFLPDNPLRQMGDLNIYIPSSEYGIVESAHATLLHYLTDAVKHEG